MAASRGTAKARACAPTTRRLIRRTNVARRTRIASCNARRCPTTSGSSITTASSAAPTAGSRARRSRTRNRRCSASPSSCIPRSREPRGSCRVRRISFASPSTARSSSRALATAARASKCSPRACRSNIATTSSIVTDSTSTPTATHSRSAAPPAISSSARTRENGGRTSAITCRRSIASVSPVERRAATRAHRARQSLFVVHRSPRMSVTEALAEYVTHSTYEAIPRDVRDEAKRAIVNYLGCALGGAVEPALGVAIKTLAPFSGNATACVLGRAERFDALHAALLNGIGSHVHEYDDTLPKNYIHPSVPVASALFAYASANPTSGRDFVHAFILGFEVESRIGNAVYPAHYTAGWHITSTTGVFGAAAAVGKLLGLTTKQMVWAFGLAATQAAGIREMFGSMAKSFQPGRAAQN